MAQNYQYGGWYNNPATGRNQRWFNGAWTDGAEPSANNQSGVNINQDSDRVNAYIDDLINQSKGQRDIVIKRLDAEHKLALGNDDHAQAQFLENVSNQLENKIGRIPYDYQRYSSRELQDYANGNQAIGENKKLALDKLSADEQAFNQNTGYQQAQQNKSTVEDLNSRGLLAGQNITGGLDSGAAGYNPLTGLAGVAGNTANIQNMGVSNNFNQQNAQFGLQNTGINNQFGQQQRGLDFAHTNKMEDLTTQARRDAQDQQNQYQFGSDDANQQFEALRRKYEQQRATSLRQNSILNSSGY